MSRKLHEELQQHVHSDLCSELNEMSIRLKIHKQHGDMSASDQALMGQARRSHPEPTTDEIIALIEKCRDEMYSCTQPFRKI